MSITSVLVPKCVQLTFKENTIQHESLLIAIKINATEGLITG